MIRVVVMVAAIAAFFSAAVFFGGSAVGAWDEPRVAPDTPDRERPRAKGRASATADRKAARAERAGERAKERWVASVNRLCGNVVREAARLRPPRTPAEALPYLEQAVALNARANDRFAALGAPPGGKADVARIVRLLRRDERLAAELLAALRHGDPTSIRTTALRLQRTAALESALLVALGARGCDGGVHQAALSAA